MSDRIRIEMSKQALDWLKSLSLDVSTGENEEGQFIEFHIPKEWSEKDKGRFAESLAEIEYYEFYDELTDLPPEPTIQVQAARDTDAPNEAFYRELEAMYAPQERFGKVNWKVEGF